MRWSIKKGIIKYYDRISEIYDVQYGDEQTRKIEKALEFVKIESKDTILDMGCGTGILLDYLKDTDSLIVGLDISMKLLKKAASRIKFCTSMHLIRADVDFMPFPRNTFSKIFSITVLQNAPFLETTLLEMKRVACRKSMFFITGLKKKFSKIELINAMRKLKIDLAAVKDNGGLKDHVFYSSGG